MKWYHVIFTDRISGKYLRDDMFEMSEEDMKKLCDIVNMSEYDVYMDYEEETK